jgi:hypothetical protein
MRADAALRPRDVPVPRASCRVCSGDTRFLIGQEYVLGTAYSVQALAGRRKCRKTYYLAEFPADSLSPVIHVQEEGQGGLRPLWPSLKPPSPRRACEGCALPETTFSEEGLGGRSPP